MENIAPITVNALMLLAFTLGASVALNIALGALLKIKAEKLEMHEVRARIAARNK